MHRMTVDGLTTSRSKPVTSQTKRLVKPPVRYETIVEVRV